MSPQCTTGCSVLLMLVGIFLFALVFLSLRWQQTECQCVTPSPQPCLSPLSPSHLTYKANIWSLSLRNRMIVCCFKKLARGSEKRKRNVLLAMCVCVTAGVHSPPCLPPGSPVICRPGVILFSANLYNLDKREEKVAGLTNILEIKSPPKLVLCWANTNSFISFPMIRNSSLSVAIYFWLLSESQGRLWLNAAYFVNASTNIYI